jgi:SH3-like domain-containing protein
MKSDVEKTIEPRVAAAFEDILAEIRGDARRKILQGARDMVKALWMAKIYAALPKDKTTVAEYFLDAELEQFLNESIEECHARICSIAQRAKEIL